MSFDDMFKLPDADITDIDGTKKKKKKGKKGKEEVISGPYGDIAI